MKDIIAPAAAQAASKKDPVRLLLPLLLAATVAAGTAGCMALFDLSHLM